MPVFLVGTLPLSFGGWGRREVVSVLYALTALVQALGGLALLAGRR